MGVLSTLLTSCVYLPLDQKWPSERRQFMMGDAECEQLVVQHVQLCDFTGFALARCQGSTAAMSFTRA